jgi:hypothetical protein
MNAFFEKFSKNPMYNSKKIIGSSTVSKLVFLLFIIFVFVIILKIGIKILSKFFIHKNNPVLLNGMIDATKTLIIPQNPNVENSIPILRSRNETGGLEFTWSVWLFINNPPLALDTSSTSSHHKHVFNKGTDTPGTGNGIMTPNNAPGLYIGNDYRSLRVVMNTFDDDVLNEEIEINDIPIEKWINVIIRCKQNKLDVFINGTLTKSHILNNIPKQNYNDVNITTNGGFSGNLSLLQYYAHAIGTNEINNIVDSGPKTNIVNTNIKNLQAKPRYLSFRWFFPEQYNSV